MRWLSPPAPVTRAPSGRLATSSVGVRTTSVNSATGADPTGRRLSPSPTSPTRSPSQLARSTRVQFVRPAKRSAGGMASMVSSATARRGAPGSPSRRWLLETTTVRLARLPSNARPGSASTASVARRSVRVARTTAKRAPSPRAEASMAPAHPSRPQPRALTTATSVRLTAAMDRAGSVNTPPDIHRHHVPDSHGRDQRHEQDADKQLLAAGRGGPGVRFNNLTAV